MLSAAYGCWDGPFVHHHKHFTIFCNKLFLSSLGPKPDTRQKVLLIFLKNVLGDSFEFEITKEVFIIRGHQEVKAEEV